MSASMRAAAIDEFGPPEVLVVRGMGRPAVAAGDVLVRVIAAGVQLTDAAIRSGWTPPGAQIEFPQVLGNEFAGIVEEVGADVDGFEVGDEVAGFNTLGCYAEYVAVPESHVVAKPPGVPWEVAGTLSASGQTAHTAFEDLKIAAGDVVLVCGAAGGVGTIFTQLAVRAGATVIGTASASNHDYVRSLGATAVSYGAGQADRIRAESRHLDVVFDAAGHENLRAVVDLANNLDRVATIVDMALAAELGCRIVRSRRTSARLAGLMGRVDTGELVVHVRRTYPLGEVADAHREVETGHGRGKVVLRIGEAR